MWNNLTDLWASAQDNVVYLLVCLGVFVALFVVAMLVERVWLKVPRQQGARRAAYIGIFAAMAAILMYLEFPLPFAPSFYEIDLSEVPVLICSFSLGPVAGVVCELVKSSSSCCSRALPPPSWATLPTLWWAAPSFSPPPPSITALRPRRGPSLAWSPVRW